MPRFENALPQLYNLIRAKERNPRQTDTERAIDILTDWIKYVDGEFEKERAQNARTQLQAKYIFQSPEGQEYVVSVQDFDAFLKAFKLDRNKMLELSEGKVPDVKGWIRPWNMGPYMGKPYQTPKKLPAIYDERHKKNEQANNDRARREQEQMNLAHYTMAQPKRPPVQFVPSSK